MKYFLISASIVLLVVGLLGQNNVEIMRGVQTVASNRQPPAAVSVAISPISITNIMNYTVMVWVTGGSMTNLAVNGSTIYTGPGVSNITCVPLQPDEWITIHHTRNPVIRWKPL